MINTKSGKTLIVGATENGQRYANRAAHSLLRYGHDIELVGLREGQIAGHPIRTGQPDLQDIDTVTMYVGARNQSGLYNYIKQLKPRRVIFNPGAENPEFAKQLRETGIEPIDACTLVMLSVGTY
ncbi:CoA-binding protein [Spirosoma soli]|uniref:CoA-binding protein n=1 Tax=Spirosoma soli TaxID=1770529 RepID=A0ABW5M9W2_9BACT